MKPIISPWVIYLIDLVDKFQGIINVVLCVLGFAIVVLGIAWLLSSTDYDQDDSSIVTCKKYLKKLIIWLGISGLLFTAIPSKDTMYTMLVLENVTTENIQDIGKTGKDMVDYIVDQIDKVVNEDEDKENK